MKRERIVQLAISEREGGTERDALLYHCLANLTLDLKSLNKGLISSN